MPVSPYHKCIPVSPRFFGQLFIIAGKTVWEDSMKKSEKRKGKTAVANRKKQYTWYIVAAVAVIVVLLVAGFYLFNPFVAKNGDTVMVYYTGSLANGTVFDSNVDGDPLIFTIGNHTVIAGFEEAVLGMAPNSTRTVNIPVDKAYGPYREDLIQVVNRSVLPSDIEPVIGHTYSIQRKTDGAIAYIRLLNFTNETLTVDQNHLLAGENLTFTLRFVGFYK
jgi:peptidylprolyl isomerase